MNNKKTLKTDHGLTSDGILNKIEEAAYYNWLDRGRYAQAGDELTDWIEAEKEAFNKKK